LGGHANQGAVFEISASTTNPVYHVIHDFGAAGDLAQPVITKLVVDAQGDLYGVTFLGGANGRGGIYMLHKADSVWTYTLLYSFGAAPDIFPGDRSNLAIDAAGNLYGCGQGGSVGGGGVFRLAPPQQAGGAWQESVLYSFSGQGEDGAAGVSGCGLTIDPATDYIVGTAPQGGQSKYNGGPTAGVLFSLKPGPNGNHWVERIEHAFFGTPIDGGDPIAPPFELNGTFYGGNTMNGSIYAFTP
jgi:hypothetical protein